MDNAVIRALLFSLALVMIFMAAFVAGQDSLGNARPLLSIAFVVMFFILMIQTFTFIEAEEKEERRRIEHGEHPSRRIRR